jgi:hypothetical protein
VTRRVYLHIGAPKTGTTYLQDRLALNARSLAEHGVHVPSKSPLVSPGLFHFRAALDLLDQDWGGRPGHARGSWDQLVRKVRRLDGTVIVSHEILAPATPAKVAKAKQDLAGVDLHIVYSARDLGRQLPAAWQESIKQGRKWSYKRYLNRIENRRPWFARAFDLPAVLATWSAGLAPEQVHVVTVPHERSDALWLRFCAAFGIDPAWAPEDSTRTNQSLGVAETQLIRQLNRRMDRVTRRETSFDELIRGMLAEDRLVQRNSAPLLLPPRMHPWARAEADRWVDWIKGAGVDVVGELDDLYPAPPVAEEDWIDPDRVGPKKQLAAALDALTAMTREAARRPDPDDALVARLRRATRRG